jgi:hypothetical protein
MSEPMPLVPLLRVLEDLLGWLKATKVQGMLIGGVAASLLGRPRLTKGLDVLVLLDEGHWADFLFAGAKHGFAPRRNDSLDFARETHVLLMRHETSGIDTDVVFGYLPFEKEAITRANWAEFTSVLIPLPSPEDLIIMKAVAHRQRDLADIEAVLDAQPKLNLRRVRRWVREFSAALEIPEILADLEVLLSRRRKQGR